jgi:hypothetical protein
MSQQFLLTSVDDQLLVREAIETAGFQEAAHCFIKPLYQLLQLDGKWKFRSVQFVFLSLIFGT